MISLNSLAELLFNKRKEDALYQELQSLGKKVSLKEYDKIKRFMVQNKLSPKDAIEKFSEVNLDTNQDTKMFTHITPRQSKVRSFNVGIMRKADLKNTRNFLDIINNAEKKCGYVLSASEFDELLKKVSLVERESLPQEAVFEKVSSFVEKKKGIHVRGLRKRLEGIQKYSEEPVKYEYQKIQRAPKGYEDVEVEKMKDIHFQDVDKEVGKTIDILEKQERVINELNETINTELAKLQEKLFRSTGIQKRQVKLNEMIDEFKNKVSILTKGQEANLKYKNTFIFVRDKIDLIKKYPDKMSFIKEKIAEIQPEFLKTLNELEKIYDTTAKLVIEKETDPTKKEIFVRPKPKTYSQLQMKEAGIIENIVNFFKSIGEKIHGVVEHIMGVKHTVDEIDDAVEDIEDISPIEIDGSIKKESRHFKDVQKAVNFLKEEYNEHIWYNETEGFWEYEPKYSGESVREISEEDLIDMANDRMAEDNPNINVDASKKQADKELEKEIVDLESEHKPTVEKIRKDISKDDKLDMTDEDIYLSIGKDHLKEHKNYYDKDVGLRNFEEELKKEKEARMKESGFRKKADNESFVPQKGDKIKFRGWAWIVENVRQDRFGEVFDLYMPGDPSVTEKDVTLLELEKGNVELIARAKDVDAQYKKYKLHRALKKESSMINIDEYNLADKEITKAKFHLSNKDNNYKQAKLGKGDGYPIDINKCRYCVWFNTDTTIDGVSGFFGRCATCIHAYTEEEMKEMKKEDKEQLKDFFEDRGGSTIPVNIQNYERKKASLNQQATQLFFIDYIGGKFEGHYDDPDTGHQIKSSYSGEELENWAKRNEFRVSWSDEARQRKNANLNKQSNEEFKSIKDLNFKELQNTYKELAGFNRQLGEFIYTQEDFDQFMNSPSIIYGLNSDRTITQDDLYSLLVGKNPRDIKTVVIKDDLKFGQQANLNKQSWMQSNPEILKQVRKDIDRAKRQLINIAKTKGIYENFGQHEIMQLQDKYSDELFTDQDVSNAIHYFIDWAENFDLSQLRESNLNKQAKEETPYARYDTGEALEDHVKDIIQNWDDEVKERFGIDEPDENIIREQICEDSYIYEFEFENFETSMDELLNKHGSKSDFVFYITAKNMGWRNLSGEKKTKIENAKELLEKVFPKTQEFSAHAYDEENGIRIIVYHHDAPTGETYRLYPAYPLYQIGDKVHTYYGDGEIVDVSGWSNDPEDFMYYVKKDNGEEFDCVESEIEITKKSNLTKKADGSVYDVMRGQAGDRVIIRAKVKSEISNSFRSLTSHYSNEQEFIDYMKSRDDWKNVEWYEVNGERKPGPLSGQVNAGFQVNSKIVQLDNGKWQVQSEKGKNLGTCNTKEEAEKRLRQVEFFKNKKGKLEQQAKDDFNEDDEEDIYGNPEDVFFERAIERATGRYSYECECLRCGKVISSEQHCRNIQCPKCGGPMRRKDRPGIGASLNKEADVKDWLVQFRETLQKLVNTDIEKAKEWVKRNWENIKDKGMEWTSALKEYLGMITPEETAQDLLSVTATRNIDDMNEDEIYDILFKIAEAHEGVVAGSVYTNPSNPNDSESRDLMEAEIWLPKEKIVKDLDFNQTYDFLKMDNNFYADILIEELAESGKLNSWSYNKSKKTYVEKKYDGILIVATYLGDYHDFEKDGSGYPKIELKGKEYYVDKQKEEIRNVKEPDDKKEFCELEDDELDDVFKAVFSVKNGKGEVINDDDAHGWEKEVPQEVDFTFFEGKKTFDSQTNEYKVLDAMGENEWGFYLDKMAASGVSVGYDCVEDVYIVENQTGQEIDWGKKSNLDKQVESFNDWFDRFLEEKNLPQQEWEIEGVNGTNFIDSDVVIEAIKAFPNDIKKKVKDKIVQIDFANGNIMDFFKYIAEGIVKQSSLNKRAWDSTKIPTEEELSEEVACVECGKKMQRRFLSGVDRCPECTQKWIDEFRNNQRPRRRFHGGINKEADNGSPHSFYTTKCPACNKEIEITPGSLLISNKVKCQCGKVFTPDRFKPKSLKEKMLPDMKFRKEEKDTRQELDKISNYKKMATIEPSPIDWNKVDEKYLQDFQSYKDLDDPTFKLIGFIDNDGNLIEGDGIYIHSQFGGVLDKDGNEYVAGITDDKIIIGGWADSDGTLLNVDGKRLEGIKLGEKWIE